MLCYLYRYMNSYSLFIHDPLCSTLRHRMGAALFTIAIHHRHTSGLETNECLYGFSTCGHVLTNDQAAARWNNSKPVEPVYLYFV